MEASATISWLIATSPGESFLNLWSWEGHYILDCLKENESNIKPDTIHSDTQGQSTAIFGLAYLLGIQLMPRIRNWKDQKLFRPSADCRCENIDTLFSGNVDWELIETMAPDMLRVAVSIQTGALLPSDILRRLTSSNKKNKLYFALRELGRVVRTIFLLRYISDLELRHTIQSATTKSERFNRFVQWVSFGGDSVIAESVRDEQRKLIKYNHLVANLLVFHNLVSMTRALRRLEVDGQQISDQVLAVLSPYASAFLKVRYLAAFTCELLNDQPMGFYSPATLVKDAQRHGLRVRPVDLMMSDWDCTLEHFDEQLTLRLGLRYVRGLQQAIAERIVICRAQQPFTSISDLTKRVPELGQADLRMLRP